MCTDVDDSVCTNTSVCTDVDILKLHRDANSPDHTHISW